MSFVVFQNGLYEKTASLFGPTRLVAGLVSCQIVRKSHQFIEFVSAEADAVGQSVETSLTNSFSKAKFKISEFFKNINPYESVRDFMIFYSSNFKFYHNINNSYEKPRGNLLQKICSAYVTKPFDVIKTKSGDRKTNTKYILFFWDVPYQL